MSFWEPSNRLKELGKKKLGEFTQEEWDEHNRLIEEWLDGIKEGLKKEWDWSEDDWHNSMSEVPEDDEELDSV
jgi:hypothetical protein